MLEGKPVIQWSVDTFHQNSQIDEIIIVSEKSSITAIESFFLKSDYPKITGIIEGGKERVDSSAAAVFNKDYNPDDIFIIHDAARPFISTVIIDKLIASVKKYSASGVYIPAKDTVAIAENEIINSIPKREKVFYAQTPQAFRYNLIMEAHKKYKIRRTGEITDDVSLVKASGHIIHMVTGSDLNFKITTELDYRVACLIAENKLL